MSRHYSKTVCLFFCIVTLLLLSGYTLPVDAAGQHPLLKLVQETPEGTPVPPTVPEPESAPPPPPAPSPVPQPAPPVTPPPSATEQKAVPPPEVRPTPPPAAPAPVRPAPRAAAPAGSSFFFDDADIFEVAQTVFGEILKVNYIIDPQVKGRVNFRTTTPIPRDKILPVMEIIFRLNGIAVIEESGLYRIIPIAGIAKEPAPIRFGKDPESVELKGTALVQVVPIEYMNSAEMAKIITPLLTQGGAVLDVPKKNFLILADTDANVKRLLQLISMFDENAAQDISQPKIYVYPLQNSKADHVSRILQQVVLGTAGAAPAPRTPSTQTPPATTPRPQPAPPTPQPGQVPSTTTGEPLVSPGTKIIPDEVTNSIVIFASPGDYALIQSAIKLLDTMPRQVLIEGIIARVDLSDNLSFGMQWKINTDLTLGDRGGLHPFTNRFDLDGTLEFNAPIDSPNFTYTARDSRGNIKLLLQSLATEGKAKVLAAPHILVSDNREARIQVGQQVPIPTSSTNVSGTTDIQTTFQYKDLGVILKVKPQVNESGLVALEITQEISSSSIETATISTGTAPVLNKTEATTNLVAQDGQTIIIGGLIREDSTKNKSGIPFLNKIPILGFLFGSTENTTSRNELVILLTPHVIRNQLEANGITNEFISRLKTIGEDLKSVRPLENKASQK
ncbi:MAG: secretin N-terminal domain-containing protein [Nitrospirota bacterium]